jgi:hypothetical protein
MGRMPAHRKSRPRPPWDVRVIRLLRELARLATELALLAAVLAGTLHDGHKQTEAATAAPAKLPSRSAP